MPKSDKLNILVIWGDDIGVHNISAYNHGIMGYRTPNIDRLAREGALFTDAYGEQSCTAGRAAFILGQHPFRTGLLTIGMPGSPHGIPDWAPTIADLPNILPRLRSANPDEVRQAIEALRVIDRAEVVPPLAELVRSGQPDTITDAALEAFRGLAEPTSIDVLTEFTRHRRAGARRRAYAALAGIEDRRIPTLLEQGLRDSDRNVRGACALALGNITGAMVFQSAIPTVVGLVFAASTWVIGEGSYTAFGSALLALLATAVIFIPARRRGGLDGRHLLVGGVFYLGYLLFVIGLIAGVFGGGTVGTAVSDATGTG